MNPGPPVPVIYSGDGGPAPRGVSGRPTPGRGESTHGTYHPSAAPSRRRPHPAGPAVAVILAIVSIALAACGEPPRKARGKLDDPQHHTLRGHDFIEKGQWDKAGRSFDLAISLGRDYGPAYAGKAIVVAHGATGAEVTEDQREDLYDKADDLVDDALDKARNPTEKRAAHVAGIRVYRLTKAKSDWVEEAEEHYEDAVELDTRGLDPDPHFFMARAYRDAFRMRKAEDLYRKVLAMNSARNREADEELALVQKRWCGPRRAPAWGGSSRFPTASPGRTWPGC